MKRILVTLLILLAASPAMAMRSYTGWAQSDTGDRLYQAEIRVYLAGTEGATSAIIYSDDGITPMAQPILTDYHGKYRFYVADGSYDIKSSYGGSDTWLYDVQIVDHLGRGAPTFRITDAAFGAIAGDAIDDSPAVQACLDSIEAAGSGVMIVPPGGDFNLDTVVNLPSNVTITGGGRLVNGVTGISNLYSFMFRSEGKSNIVIDGIEIDGNTSLSGYNGTAYPGVMYFAGCENLTLRNCHIYDSSSDGILVSEYNGGSTNYGANTNVSITGNLFERCRRDGVVISGAKGVVISGNRIIDTYGVAIDAEPYYSNSDPRESERMVIADNYCYTTIDGVWTGWEPLTVAHGLDVTCQDWDQGVVITGVSITGNHFESYTDSPDPDATYYIREVNMDFGSATSDSTDGPACIFSGNIVKTNRISTATGSYGMVNVRTNVSLVMDGNHIEGPYEVNSAGNYGAYRGASITGDAGTLYNLQVSDNIIRGYFQIGIHLSTVRDASLTGNNIWMDQPDSGTSTATYGIRLYGVDGVGVTGGSIHTAGYPVYISGAAGVEENNIVFTGVRLHSRRLNYMARFESNAVINTLAFRGCMVNHLWGPKGGDDIIRTYTLGGAVVNGYSDRGTVLADGGDAAAGTKQFAIKAIDYGAKADDSLDDTAAIQAAIDAAEANGGCYVDLPSGQFRLTGGGLTIEDHGVILRGATRGYENEADRGTVLAPLSAMSGPLLTISSGGVFSIYRSGVENITFRSGGAYYSDGLLALVNCRDCIVRDCSLYMNDSEANGNAALMITSTSSLASTGNRIEDCYIHSTRYLSGPTNGTGYGVEISNPTGTYNTSNYFTNCKFYDPSNSGDGSYFVLETGTNVGANIFSNCHFGTTADGTNKGLHLAGLRGGDVLQNCIIDGEAADTLLTFGDLTSGAAASYFQGSIDGVWVDLNDSEDDYATVIDNGDDNQMNIRALRLIPRSAMPASPALGSLAYDSDTNDVMVYTDQGWEILFDGAD